MNIHVCMYSCVFITYYANLYCPLQEFDTQKVQCIVCLCEESNLILKNTVYMFSIIDCIMHGSIICCNTIIYHCNFYCIVMVY